jgi:hypothetical protein
MSIVERDERATQLADTSRDLLQSPRLRAVVDPMSEEWLAIDDPDNPNEDEWVESNEWVELGDWQ